MRNSRRYMPRSLRERLFSFFLDTAHPRSMSAAAARRAVLGESESLQLALVPVLRERMSAHCCADDRALEVAVRARMGPLSLSSNRNNIHSGVYW
jgi:hypothetical protein